MSGYDDFQVNNPNEDRIDGTEDYITEGWDKNEGVLDPNENDDAEKKAETITERKDVDDLAEGNKTIEEPEEAELSS